jgi:pentatricopeptide repeat protein
MTTSNSASLAAVADEGLWHTNPVWCIDRLLEAWGRKDRSWVDQPELLPALLRSLLAQGIRLPTEALQRWESAGLLDSTDLDGDSADVPSPGVVGLVIDHSSETAWVVPLDIEPSRTWSVDSNLPIRPPTVLQDMLIRVVLALDMPQAGAVPERFAFDVRERLGRRSYGPSMHIAGLLAVIDRQNNNPTLLRRACAAVQPDGDRLVPVGSLDKKLGAFWREYGRGSLLVRPPDCPEASAYDQHFDEIWQVGSFQELARALERCELLQGFLSGAPLDAADVETAHSCLRRLTFAEHRYGEALNLAGRIQRCGYDSEVPARTGREIRRTTADLYRHLGYYGEAETLAQQEVRETKASKASSYDDQAQADAIYAASYYDPHCFTRMVELLEQPWLAQFNENELLVSPETRVMVFNTLARAYVILGQRGWAELFRRSEEILREREPTDLPRTWNYLAHGLLRQGQLEEADSVLVQLESLPALTGFSRWICRFLRAEYHRSRGRKWHSEEMEAASGVKKRAGHPFGFYFQATARQPDRSQVDAGERFRLAQDLFLQDAGSGDHPNILHFLADCMRIGAAGWGNDAVLWSDARQALARHLEPRSGCGLAEYYAEVWKALGDRPDRDTADAFLRRVPFF